MIEDLAAFGLLCLIIIIVYIINYNHNIKYEKDRDNIELLKYIDFPVYLNYDKNSSEGKKELRRILSNPDIRKRAEERRKEDYRKKQYEEDLKRKDLILKRTFSYKYENVLYEIFAPYATPRKYENNGQKWGFTYEIRLENNFVIKEIIRLLKISIEDAKILFKEFNKNDMLVIHKKNVPNGTVLGEWVRTGRCSLGNLLIYDWNIISNHDMNLSKWIEQHPIRESKDSVDKRRGVIKERISFNEFIKREGEYTLKYDYPSVKIKMKNGILLYIDDSIAESLTGKKIQFHQYRLKDLLLSIKDKLIVDIDDEQYILCVEE